MKRLNFLIPYLIICLLSCTKDKLKKEKSETNILYDKAFDFRERGEADSAFIYYSRAKDLFLLRKDSVGVGKCLVNMAIISVNKGDDFGGQELSINALSYIDKEKKDQHSLMKSNLNNLGIASFNLQDYSQAIIFYKQSLNYIKDTLSLLTVKGNIANAYYKNGDIKMSLSLYNALLKLGEKNKKEYARILTNVTSIKWLQNPDYDAAPYFLKALQIRQEENDQAGMHASYGYLSDYYAPNDQDSALIYARQMYKTAQKIKNPSDQILALQKLIKLSPIKQTKEYFKIYEILTDSVQKATSSSKKQFALIRYETDKHKAKNLILEKDNIEKKYQIIKQRALLAGGLVFAFFAIVLSIILYKKRKQRLELASKNAIRENQLKTSKKVHDIVANGLYRVMAEIENNDDLNRDQVLDKLEDMYEKSRNLSYEELHYTDQNFHEKIASLLKSFATENIKIVFVGNTEDLWKKVTSQIKYEVEHILQELMVNMKKHSGASNVAIRFEQKENQIAIYYADNGIGMLQEQEFNNGLTNTGNRITAIDGEITFDTKAEKGLKIQISFPIS